MSRDEDFEVMAELDTQRALVQRSGSGVGPIWWKRQANRIAEELAEYGDDFVNNASIQEICSKAGGWFVALDDSEKQSIISTLRNP